jgi:hypothetical protein
MIHGFTTVQHKPEPPSNPAKQNQYVGDKGGGGEVSYRLIVHDGNSDVQSKPGG